MSGAIVGLEGAMVEVEVDISPGLPNFFIVGLPDAAVQEARERVRAAIRNSGFTFPMRRIVVNLAPADLKKAGPAYDLPIAVGILLSSEQVTADVSDLMLLGELSLDGSLRHTNGILPMVALAHDEGIPTVIVPEADAREASLVEGVKIIPVASLAQLVSLPARARYPAPESLPADATAANAPLAARHRPRRYQGAGARQARPGGGRRRRAQRHHVRAAGQRQDPAGALPALHPAAHDQR